MTTNTDLNNLGSAANQYSFSGEQQSSNTAVSGQKIPTTNPAVGYSGLQMAMMVLLMIGQEATSLSQQVTLLSSQQKNMNQGLLQFAQTEKSSPQTDFSSVEFSDETSLAEVGLTSNSMSMSAEDSYARGDANNTQQAYLFGKQAIEIYKSMSRTNV